MTNEEAIKRLKKLKSIHNGSYAEEIDMAIKALEQEPSEDCVSREAVLEYIEGSEAELGHSSENELVCQDIKELPSVTPQPKIGHWRIKDGKEQGYDIAGIKTWYIQIVRSELGHSSENELVCQDIKELPSVTPQPKIGHWRIKDGKEQGYDIAGIKTWYIQIVCSECGFIKTAIEGHTGQWRYCPNCGAKMIEQALAYADQDTLMPAT